MPAKRKRTAARGYGARWQKYRALFVQLFPLCARCNMPAEQVDHIVRSSPNDALFWDTFNHQSLCLACHGQKTRKEAANAYHFVDRDKAARREQVERYQDELLGGCIVEVEPWISREKMEATTLARPV